MENLQIRFDDGAVYEAFMGRWSALVGDSFLHWLAAPAGLRWLDVGCGNGAFTELLSRRCAPREVDAIDPSESQLAFARARAGGGVMRYRLGDATALPYPDHAFDAAVMALVIFFVPDPARGVAEMARVVRPGGSISAYAWDLAGGGFPFVALHEEMAALGTPALQPPNAQVSRIDALEALWTGAGIEGVQTRQIEAERTFPNFDAFWQIARSGPGIGPEIDAMAPEAVQLLLERMRVRLPVAADGSVVCRACANAVKGCMPG